MSKNEVILEIMFREHWEVLTVISWIMLLVSCISFVNIVCHAIVFASYVAVGAESL